MPTWKNSLARKIQFILALLPFFSMAQVYCQENLAIKFIESKSPVSLQERKDFAECFAELNEERDQLTCVQFAKAAQEFALNGQCPSPTPETTPSSKPTLSFCNILQTMKAFQFQPFLEKDDPQHDIQLCSENFISYEQMQICQGLYAGLVQDDCSKQTFKLEKSICHGLQQAVNKRECSSVSDKKSLGHFLCLGLVKAGDENHFQQILQKIESQLQNWVQNDVFCPQLKQGLLDPQVTSSLHPLVDYLGLKKTEDRYVADQVYQLIGKNDGRLKLAQWHGDQIQDLPKYAFNRYGTYGTEALGKLTELGKMHHLPLEKLITDAGIVMRIDEFSEFLQESQASQSDQSTDPWKIRQAFKDKLGKVTYYRALYLSEGEFKTVLSKGMLATALRSQTVSKALLHQSLTTLLGYKINEDRPDKNFLMSFSRYPHLAVAVAKLYTNKGLHRLGQGHKLSLEVQEASRQVYLFELELDALDVLHYGGAYERFLPDQMKILDPSKGAYLIKHPLGEELHQPDEKIESLIPWKISPHEIKAVKRVEQLDKYSFEKGH